MLLAKHSPHFSKRSAHANQKSRRFVVHPSSRHCTEPMGMREWQLWCSDSTGLCHPRRLRRQLCRSRTNSRSRLQSCRLRLQPGAFLRRSFFSFTVCGERLHARSRRCRQCYKCRQWLLWSLVRHCSARPHPGAGNGDGDCSHRCCHCQSRRHQLAGVLGPTNCNRNCYYDRSQSGLSIFFFK